MLQKLFFHFKAELFLAWVRHLAFALFLIQFSYFCHLQTDGFTIRKIQSDLAFNPKFETPAPKEEELQNIQEILKQKFYYLGKGAQCYAFISEDEKYVLKLIRFPRLSISPILKSLPLPLYLQPWRIKKAKKMQARLERHFASFKIAHDNLKEETGIVFLHLNKTNFLKTKIALHDKLKIAHVLSSDNLEFILQKKADLIYPSLDRLMNEKKIEEAKGAIDSIVGLFVKRCKKGIFDADPNIYTNLGLIENHALQFDVGRFCLDAKETDPTVYLSEIIRITSTFAEWLKQNHPELATYLEEKIVSLANEEKVSLSSP